MAVNNPYGKHSFYDLDESWYRYLAADRKTRQRMCEEMIETEALVLGVAVVAGIILGIVALCNGWI